MSKVGAKKDNQMKSMEIFTTWNTEKVLQDRSVSQEMKRNTIKITAVKNSYELCQVIVVPNFDVANCGFFLSPLENENGTLFDVMHVEKFYQKYIEVKEISWKEEGGATGWFPDLLLPYDVALAHKENTIRANQNQALVLIFHIDENQEMGTYRGKIAVFADEMRCEIPIEMEVCDVVLPKLQKSDSLFCMEYEFVERGEQDSSLEMKEAYVETLLKYKQFPRSLPQATDTPEDFCKAVRKYYSKVVGFSIPMDVCPYWGAPRKMDYDYFRRHVLALAKISLEDGINYFDKVRNYLITVDEPQQNKVENAASYTCRRYRETLLACADEVERFDFPDAEITKKQVSDAIRKKTYNLITSSYTDQITGVDIWCPVYKKYADAEYLKKCREGGKPYWGYSCNAQTSPLPNYHIDDMNSFLSARVLGTIMKEYGVSGNLYYETVFFEKLSYTNGLHLEPTDAYADAMKYPGTNGDGYLFYPGKRYGMKGPIVCNRLSYIRDAVQDYDLLWVLEKTYEEKGEDAAPLLESVYRAVHEETKVLLTAERFFTLKRAVIQAAVRAKNGEFFKDISQLQKEKEI